MRHLVLGTAGHIDHGKSALVQALTGTDPDRLAEEKRRGITIDLGFADLEVGDGRLLSFVDVPGHERFVRHMVAGATGIDAVLMVVAADQGVQPQTREHLQICSLLGVERGVIALTKCDLVDSELCEVAALELHDLLSGTSLEHAPLVPVSARTGQGLDELKASLDSLFDSVVPRSTSGPPRLPVDRSFVLRGFGTVVTGTLVSGALSEGEELEILPAGKAARARGLQTHHRSVQTACAGQRTAVNVQGLGCEDVPRGSTLTRPGALRTSHRIWARLQLLDDAPETLQGGGLVRFHQGTCERAARLRVIDREADGTLHAELYLSRETVLAPGDRFILRRPAPVDTVGGGIVIDIRPPRARLARPRDFSSEACRFEHSLPSRLERAGAVGSLPAELAPELGATLDQVKKLGADLAECGAMVEAGPRWFDGDRWRQLAAKTLERLDRCHAEQPLRVGIGREELRAAACAEMPQEAWRILLGGLERDGAVRLTGELIARAGHTVELSDADEKLAAEIVAAFHKGRLDPPEPATVVGAGGQGRAAKILELLISQGRVVRLHDGKLFGAEALEDLRSRLRDYGRDHPRIGVAEFKELAGISRKNAIPLLEHLDAEGSTRRIGNQREILLR